MSNTLLIEILSEELPPQSLFAIRDAFADSVLKSLQGFLELNNTIDKFISPRRFGMTITGINETEDDKIIKKKGPAVISAMINGQPSRALEGFMKSTNSVLDDLIIGDDGYYYSSMKVSGRSLDSLITDCIAVAVKAIPVSKAMRWANNDYSFIRPIHNIIVMYNDTVLSLSEPILGVTSSNSTIGHRFMSSGDILISNANQYINILESNAYVIPSYEKRIEIISSELIRIAKSLGLHIYQNDSLLEEVAALVEYPVVLQGEFSSEFLQVPQECLILSMSKNQKYFALVDANKKMSNKFLFVSNIKSHDPSIIINGNQKVLAARLTDAKFFYDFDGKTKLISQLDKLKSIVYHNKIGTQYERVLRMADIAKLINHKLSLGINDSDLECTIKLIKADLVTEMVGEFPELQGTMGKYYALKDGYSQEIANAIESHYLPKFSGDVLPSGDLAKTVALVDKLETLVGIFGIGLIPTGDKDPFALRRTALGIVRILLKSDISIVDLLETTANAFAKDIINNNIVSLIYDFILNRLNGFLSKELDYPQVLVNAVLATKPVKFNNLLKLLDSLKNFSNNDSSKIIITSNKRIDNILRKNNINTQLVVVVRDNLFENNYETELYQLYLNLEPQISVALADYDYTKYFMLLAKFADALSKFFDNVMVMSDNLDVQQNRINILINLYQVFNKVTALTEVNI